ncbi:dTDP-4-dehydrorhamnose reductase [Treponema berlinense]|uniref:dTDP-4-dehydrorhamnose reductase n=1 Tax=Treponema berlinense TaxID=225004 RepID=A0A1T4MGU0_9SPIR|nr:dTDP-4-dehydrorhamnose reductase [Treponema berlinense]SJZ66239.1 dTDP-4-dehydrorhamnose reductase [Treponema berlinense]
MIWVIGYKGMLGSEICRQLGENNIQFVRTDVDVDITDIEALDQFAKCWAVTWIINCAAYTAVDKAESDIELAHKLNVEGPENIAKVAKKYGARLIHISTDYVFDGTGDTPRTEDMPVAPIGVYGVTKAKGEEAVRNNTDKYYILRTAWLYGWAGKNFVYTMIRAMNTHDAVKVVNDQKGTPTFAGDLANVILTIISKKGTVPYGIYHCTDLGEITWWDFTNEIKKQGIEKGLVTNKECVVNPCTTDEYPTPAKRPAYSVLSKDKIQNALGITLPDWKESLSKFLHSELFDKSRIE